MAVIGSFILIGVKIEYANMETVRWVDVLGMLQVLF